MRWRDLAGRRHQRVLVGTGEGELLHDPLSAHDLVVNGDSCVRECAHPGHRVLGCGITSLDLDLARRLKDGVVAVQIPDALLLVRVERVDEPASNLASVCHSSSLRSVPWSDPTPPQDAVQTLGDRVRDPGGQDHPEAGPAESARGGGGPPVKIAFRASMSSGYNQRS